MTPSNIHFVKFVVAENSTMAIKIRLLLDRAKVPYMVKNENVQHLFGGGAIGGFNPVTGPMEFHVPEHLIAQAQEAMQEIFDIHYDDLPDNCPACDTHIPEGKVDCPSCGLFLG